MMMNPTKIKGIGGIWKEKGKSYQEGETIAQGVDHF